MPSLRAAKRSAPAEPHRQPPRRRSRAAGQAPLGASSPCAPAEEGLASLPPALAALPLEARSEPFLPVETCARYTAAVYARLRPLLPPGK
eukprot:9234046-Alexandrium_andersonii.AAC.1